jgi:dUTP pyrophosphatase
MTATQLKIPLQRMPHGNNLDLPSYATELSAGMDLIAAVEDPISLEPGERAVIPSGIAIALPQGFEAQVRPRSGLAAKHGVTVLNSPGTIDADYRGEISIILVNFGNDTFHIDRGMRIAQMVVAAIETVTWSETDTLPASVRGDRGFGSTG